MSSSYDRKEGEFEAYEVRKETIILFNETEDGQWIGGKAALAQQRVRLGIVAALEQKPADFPAFSAAHGGVRLSSEAWAGRRDLVPWPWAG